MASLSVLLREVPSDVLERTMWITLVTVHQAPIASSRPLELGSFEQRRSLLATLAQKHIVVSPLHVEASAALLGGRDVIDARGRLLDLE